MSSYCERGLELELLLSGDIHKRGIPILISPMFLREYGQGQIDIINAELVNGEWVIKCYEVKSSSVISKRQIFRLKGSGTLISAIFGLVTKIYFSYGRENLCQIN